jgi:hypothetical protein
MLDVAPREHRKPVAVGSWVASRILSYTGLSERQVCHFESLGREFFLANESVVEAEFASAVAAQAFKITAVQPKTSRGGGDRG